MGGCCWKRGRQAWAWPGPCSGPRGHPVVFQAWRAVCGPAPWATPGCGPASFLCESVPAWEEGSRQGQWLSVRDNNPESWPWVHWARWGGVMAKTLITVVMSLLFWQPGSRRGSIPVTASLKPALISPRFFSFPLLRNRL